MKFVLILKTLIFASATTMAYTLTPLTDGSGTIVHESNSDSMVLTFIDSSGKLLWQKRHKLCSPYVQGILDVGDGFLTTGYCSGQYNSELIKFDRDGDLLWHKKYSKETFHSPLLKTASGRVFGLVAYDVAPAPAFKRVQYIVEIDNVGELHPLWRLESCFPYRSPEKQFFPSAKLIVARNGDFILWDNYSDSPGVTSDYLHFCRMNSRGQVRWRWGMGETEATVTDGSTNDDILVAPVSPGWHDILVRVDSKGGHPIFQDRKLEGRLAGHMQGFGLYTPHHYLFAPKPTGIRNYSPDGTLLWNYEALDAGYPSAIDECRAIPIHGGYVCLNGIYVDNIDQNGKRRWLSRLR